MTSNAAVVKCPAPVYFVGIPAFRIARFSLGPVAAPTFSELYDTADIAGMVATGARSLRCSGVARCGVHRRFHVRGVIEGNGALTAIAVENDRISGVCRRGNT